MSEYPVFKTGSFESFPMVEALSSLVPVIGFTLSTVSLNLVRTVWEKNRK